MFVVHAATSLHRGELTEFTACICMNDKGRCCSVKLLLLAASQNYWQACRQDVRERFVCATWTSVRLYEYSRQSAGLDEAVDMPIMVYAARTRIAHQQRCLHWLVVSTCHAKLFTCMQ